MAFDEERKKKIVSDFASVVGVAATIDFCSSSNELLATLLRSGETIPNSVVEQLALHQCLEEIVHEVYRINPEIFELEKQKCYIELENIMKKAREADAANQQQPDNQNIIQFGGAEGSAFPIGPEDIGSVINGILSNVTDPLIVQDSPIVADVVSGETTEVESVNEDGGEDNG